MAGEGAHPTGYDLSKSAETVKRRGEKRCMLCTMVARITTQDDHSSRILRVLIHIQTNLDRELPTEELARVACFSEYHFHRVFRGMVGESVAEHIRRLRLERAAIRLKTTRKPVIDLAMEAGYEAHEGFTRAFVSCFGLSPTAFRKRHGTPAITQTPSGVHYSPSQRLGSFTMQQKGDAMEAKIEKRKPVRVAFVRHIGPYNQCGAAWEKLCAWAGPRGLLGPNTAFFGVCHSDPEVTPPDKIQMDACITVGENVHPEGAIGVQEIPGGDFAITMHKGPYSELHRTYAELCGQWLPGQKREPAAGPSIERYINNPGSVAENELLTEVCIPVA